MDCRGLMNCHGSGPIFLIQRCFEIPHFFKLILALIYDIGNNFGLYIKRPSAAPLNVI